MKGVLLPVSLFLAVAATAALALLVLRDRPADENSPEEEEVHAGATGPLVSPRTPQPKTLRPYETTVTLTEDLRDALPTDPARLNSEVWRVSRALEGKARWMLGNPVRREASPKVRALLVLATGVHAADEPVLHGYLEDPAPVVRRAAALATGYGIRGDRRARLLDAVVVPLGRQVPPETRLRLKDHRERESDASVRTAIDAVLNAR